LVAFFFQVENTLFRVLKKYFVVPGTAFETMFSLPSGNTNRPREGERLGNPIHSQGVKEADFRTFLRVIHPLTNLPAVSEYGDWIGVLRLANMWEFKEVREKAIDALSVEVNRKKALEKLSLGHEYRVAQWVREGYRELLQMPRPMKMEELNNPSLFPHS